MNKFHNDPITNILLEGMLLENPIYQQSYTASKMLVEYALNPDQIAKVFAQAEKEMTAGGANRTLVGKATDKTTAAAQAVSAGWNKVKNAIASSGPVSGFDQKFDALKGQLLQAAGGQEGAVNKAITAYRNFAKQHPVMQGAIYAGLIALAGISGAGLGGAAILSGIKLFDRILQGDKLSSAIWQGFKTGATAMAAGAVGQGLQADPTLSPNAGSPAGDMGGTMAGATDATTAGSPAADAAGGTGGGVDTYKPGPEGGSPAGDTGGTQSNTVNRDTAIQRSIDTDNPGTPAPPETQPVTIKKGDNLSTLAKKFKVSVKDLIDANPQYADNPNMIRAGDTIQIPQATGNSIYQGGVGTAADTAKRVAAAAARKRAGIGENRFIDYSKTYQQWRLNEGKEERIAIYLNEEGVNAVFYLVNEGIWDTLKGAAGKAVGAVKDKAAQIGSNITNKVTADKLNKAWQQGPGFSYSGQAKSVDSKVVQDFLVKQGVDPTMAANAIKAVSASNVPQGGGKVAGQLSQTPGAIKKRAQRAAAKAQAQAPAAQPAAPAASPAKPMSYGGSVGASMGKPKIKVPAGSAPAAE